MDLFRLSRPLARLLVSRASIRDWRGIRFLCYHVVDESDSHNESVPTTVTKDDFRSHLKWFRENDFSVVAMDTALELLKNGRAGRGRYLCLTFDDGTIDNYFVAWPMLRDFGFSAHFFIASDRIGKTKQVTVGGRQRLFSFMGSDELRQIVAEGGSIGSHTATHRHLDQLTKEDMWNELIGSRQSLEAILGVHVSTLAYPYSDYNREVLEMLPKCGYTHAFKLEFSRVSKITGRNPFVLPRIPINGGALSWLNFLAIEGGYDWVSIYSIIRRGIRCGVFR